METDVANIIGFVAKLRSAIEWLQSLGVSVEGTRFSQYITQLDDAVSTPGLEARDDAPNFPSILEAFDSGSELLVIKRDLAQINSQELRSRLDAFVKGPYLQSEERPETGSNRARNYGFELIFAAQLVRAKFTPILPEIGDLRTKYPDIRFECKRPQSERKFNRALKDARDQLLELDNARESINVIALSVGKSLHGGTPFLHGGDHQDVHRAFRESIDNLVRRHEHVWQTQSFAHVGGIWLHYSGAAAFSKLNALVRASYNRVIVRPNPRHKEREAGIRLLATELEKNLDFGPFHC